MNSTRRLASWSHLFIYLLIVVWGSVLSRQAFAIYTPTFQSLEAEHGLSMNTVTDITADKKGYLWIATQAGLNRYDGQNIKVYLKKDGKYGPSGNHITQLFYSKRGELWVNTINDGLNRYHADTDSFSVFTPSGFSINSNDISDINEDKHGNLWLATHSHGIWVISLDKNSVLAHLTQGTDAKALLSNNVLTLFADQFERMWIASLGGLQLFDEVNERLLSFPLAPTLLEPITALADAGKGENGLWLGSKSGLSYFDIDNAAIIATSEIISDSLINTPVTSLIRDMNGNLWMGLLNAGLVKYQADSGQFQRYNYNPSNINSLTSDAVNHLFIDDEQQLWIGTKGAGLNKIYLDAKYFNSINEISFERLNLTNSDIRAIYRDRSQTLWVGTSSGLFSAIESGNQAARKIVGFNVFSGPAQLEHSFISFVREDASQHLWVGTRGRGLFIFSADRQSYHHYQHVEGDPHSLPSDNLYSILFDSQGRTWIGTKDAGLTRYLDAERGFTTLAHDNDAADTWPINEVIGLLEDTDGNIWATTYGAGLVKLDKQGKLTQFSTDTVNTIPSKYLFSLYQTPDNLLWVASSDGVFSFDPLSKTTRLFNTENGLVGNVCYLMQLDTDNRLWIGTSTGLSILDTQDLSIQNYTKEDGLQDNEFNFSASFVDSDSSLYLGGINGFNHIYPMKLPAKHSPNAPVIEQLFVMNSPQKVQDDPRFNQGRDISAASSIRLEHRDVFFALHFHSPALHQANELIYEYKMEGLHEQWLSDLGSRAAYFTGLSPGQYRFLVRSKDINGNESPTTQLAITITPAPWQTWWAYCLYVIVATSIIGGIIISRTLKYRKQSQLLEQIANSEQRLQLALWGSGDEFWDWDLANESVTRSNTFLVYPQNETHLKATLATHVHPEDLAAIMPNIQACFRESCDNFELTYRAKSKSQEWLWVLNRGKVVSRRTDGKPQRITGTIKNIQNLKQTEAALRQLTFELEDRVRSRTEELQSTNDSLTATLEELKLTQSELIDKEKMATLGGLVASITHEINTPIGISVTTSSHLTELVKHFNQSFENGEVGEDEFQHYQAEVADCARLMQTNLERAVKLIKSFKQVSVDQSHEELREFNLGLYLDEIFLSLNPMLSRTAHHYQYQCPPNIIMNSNPGIFYQIISNLFNNSIIHAYPDGRAGMLELTISLNDQGVAIDYRDDGCGMSLEVQEKIFAPFFTTKRGKGGSGLGMNIVFNLVTQVLGGEISLHSSPGEGAAFHIQLPHSILVTPKT